MTDIGISAFFAAIFLVALVPLTVQVGIKRLQTGIFFGDGGDPALARRRAAQSNYLDHVPIFLMSLVLSEIAGAPHWLLVGAGSTMALGRLLHACTLLFTAGTGNGRAIGMIMTFLAHLALAFYLASIGFAAMRL